MATVLINPEINLPFRVVGKTNPQHEQDSETDVVQQAIIVLRYELGQRDAIPTFGISDQTFSMKGVNQRELLTAVRRWVPDATMEIVNEAITQLGEIDVEIHLSREDPARG